MNNFINIVIFFYDTDHLIVYQKNNLIYSKSKNAIPIKHFLEVLIDY